MIKFKLKKVSSHYNLTFMKLVHKRSGEIVEEEGDTLYTIPLSLLSNLVAHEETSNKFKDEDISLSEYLKEFHKSYKEICELLKKTL